ncbi:MAG TPA: response regulator [Candidatus Angelobacter sp.]|nr:response regulator [Candidatus Angelobacter sp.]
MDLKDASVLLVDDEPLLREIMAEWLRRTVKEVFCAENGDEAGPVLAAHKVDLVLSDVRMPVMDGIALLKKINLRGKHRPRMIFMTGFSDLTLREAHDMGADALLEKPMMREELLREAQRSLTDPEELWRMTPAETAPILKLKADYESLAAAREKKRIAFGRRGFCIAGNTGLHTGPVDFTLAFKADQRAISGRGTVRWTAPQEDQAGVEITYLTDASRSWIIDLTHRNHPVSFIPASTGLTQVTNVKTA